MPYHLYWLKRSCRLFGVASVVVVLAAPAGAVPSDGALNESYRPTLSAYAQYDDDADEEFGDVDLDDEDRDFEYDEDEGSLLVDIENCEPGKYWMLDFEDGVMLPCK